MFSLPYSRKHSPQRGAGTLSVGQVKVLDSKHNKLLHNCINGVPALVLDCNRSIDFKKDVEAQEELARQVQAYFQFVQALQKYNNRSRLITLGCALTCITRRAPPPFTDVCTASCGPPMTVASCLSSTVPHALCEPGVLLSPDLRSL